MFGIFGLAAGTGTLLNKNTRGDAALGDYALRNSGWIILGLGIGAFGFPVLVDTATSPFR